MGSVFQQKPRDLHVASLAGSVERRFAFVVGDVDVRSPLEELADPFGIVRSVVVSAARLDQQREAHPVRLVDGRDASRLLGCLFLSAFGGRFTFRLFLWIPGSLFL